MLALLSGALLFGLGACGQLNDHPAEGISAQVIFPSAAAASSGATPQAITIPDTNPALSIESVVVGAIVLTFVDKPFTSADDINTDARKKGIQDDAIQSAKYFTVITNPTTEKTVSFLIPPDGAGNWVLIGIGLRDKIKNLNDISDLDDDAPIYYGFAYDNSDPADPKFLNDTVKPGDTLVLKLTPACSYTTNNLATAYPSLCPAK
jgi:hypothetical protein